MSELYVPHQPGPYERALSQSYKEIEMRFYGDRGKPEAPPPEAVATAERESVIEEPPTPQPPPVIVKRRSSLEPRHVWIQRMVAREFGLCREDLTGPRRLKHICVPRFVSMMLCSVELRASLTLVARWHKRDHTTVLSGLTRLKEMMEANGSLRERVERLRAQASQWRVTNEHRGEDGAGACIGSGGGEPEEP